MEDREQLSVRLAAVCTGGALALLALGAHAAPAGEAPAAGAPIAADAPAATAGAEAPAEAPAATPAVDLHRLHQEAVESFYTWDGDRDGFVAALEAMEMTPEDFVAADRDGDGKLTLVEWVDARFAATPAARAPR